MPKDSVNLYLSIQSGSSERTVTSLTDKVRALDKEEQLLKQATDALAKANKPLTEEQVRLQAQMKASQKAVNELQKAYDECGDEMMKMDLDQAIENHARLKNELSEVNAQLGANQKTYKEYLETVRKGALGDGGSNGFSALAPVSPGSASSGVNAMSLLAGLGVGDKLSSLAQDLGGAMLTSALGSEMGGLATGALSGALSGAALGSVIPGLGTAVGALLGGALGAAQGGVRIFEARDDAFKDYYGGLYQDVSGRSGEMVGAGSTLASGRQTDRISFTTMFGDEQTAKEYLENLVSMSNNTPFLYDDLVAMSKTLATYGYSPDEGSEDYILDALQTIGDTGAALGMGTGDMTAVAQALGRMKSSDKTTLEYLNILNDRGIGAMGMLAQAKGVDQGKIYEMISKGQISGSETVNIITAALRDAYTGTMEDQSKTFAGISSTLEGLEQELQNAGGDAYNELRQSGKSEMVAAYDGALGDAIKEINAVVGENQARKENLQDQYMREVLDMVLRGNQGSLWSTFDQDQQNALTEMSQEFARWSQQYEESGRTDEEAGAQMESLYEQAQVLGQAYFDNSDLMKTLHDVEEDEVEAIRQNTAGLEHAYTATYNLSQVMSRGLIVHGVGGYTNTAPTSGELADAEATVAAWRADPDSVTPEQMSAAQNALADSAAAARRNAFGLDRVPYDDYPALLHEGERVLTAAEARAQDAGNVHPLAITITGNSFTGTPEDMAYELAQIILQRLTEAGIAAAPK